MPAGRLMFRPADMTAPWRLIGAPAPRHSENAMSRMVGKSVCRQAGIPIGRLAQASLDRLPGLPAARHTGCPVCRNVGLMRRHAPCRGGRVQRAMGPLDAPPLRRRLSLESSTNAGWERVAGLQAFGRHSVMPLCWHVVVSACRPRGRESTPGLATGARGFVPPSCVPPCRRAAELGDTSRLPTSMALARFV